MCKGSWEQAESVPFKGGNAMQTLGLGIDVSKRWLTVSLVSPGTPYQKALKKTCDNSSAGITELLKWLDRKAGVPLHVVLEATGTYGEAVAEALFGAGHTVSFINPARLEAYGGALATRTKTDAMDAWVMARFAVAMDPEPWTPPNPDLKTLQRLTRRRKDLVEMLQQEKNRREAGGLAVEEERSIERVISSLEQEIAELEKQIDDHIDRHPGLKSQSDLLLSIPGIGETTAATLLGEIGEVSNYRDVRALVAYFGLAPRHRESGSSVHGKPRMSKKGNKIGRTALYMPAIVAKRCNPTIRAFCERLEKRQLSPKAIIGAAMRKLLHIVYGVLKHQQPFQPVKLTA